MSKLKFRMISAERAGYGTNTDLFVVQRWSSADRLWYDIGDPLPRVEALARLKERRES